MWWLKKEKGRAIADPAFIKYKYFSFSICV
jgi:hypothetical protein